MSQTVAVVVFQTQASMISECYKDKPLYTTCEGKYQQQISALDIDPVSKFPFILYWHCRYNDIAICRKIRPSIPGG